MTSTLPTPRRPTVRRRPARALAVLALATLGACGDEGADPAGAGGGAGGGAGDGGDAAACSTLAMNRTVDANMRDYYLFADRVPSVDPVDADSPESLIRALRVAPDRFSYVAEAARTAAFFDEGKSFDYGWIIERDVAGRAVIALVQPGSPLDVAGVRRGEILHSIEGIALDDIVADPGRIDALLGTGREVRTIRLDLEAADGTVREVAVTRGEFDVRTVIDVRTLEPAGPGGPRVGYLHLLSFIETTRSELDAAFAYLAEEGVDELVLDLRYNGGGRIGVAETLASRIVGAGGAGRDFTRFRFNDRYQGEYEALGLADDLRLPFRALPDSLDLPRVLVLSTDRTCSASEMVVNALEPLMDVVVVGGTSCGKPFGTTGEEFCGKVMHAVEMEFVNDAGVGGYTDGIPADCAAVDDPSRALGDPAEAMLAGALAHIADGTCPAAFAKAAPGTIRRRAGEDRLSEPTNPLRDEVLAR